MAGSMYQYGTNPRKVQPEYSPKKRKTKKKSPKQTKKSKAQLKAEEMQRMEQLKKEKKIHYQNIAIIISMFLLLLTISYRNSLITEKFNQIQNLKSLEKAAKNKLGMQKLDKEQKVYVTIPKKDYTESATPEVKTEESTNWFTELFSKLFK